jgi:hypothetical protein
VGPKLFHNDKNKRIWRPQNDGSLSIFRLNGPELTFSNSRKYKILKKRFTEYNSENNGVLSRNDIFNLCKSAGFQLSEPEVLQVQISLATTPVV